MRTRNADLPEAGAGRRTFPAAAKPRSAISAIVEFLLFSGGMSLDFEFSELLSV